MTSVAVMMTCLGQMLFSLSLVGLAGQPNVLTEHASRMVHSIV
jgi:hypothetical protein